VPFITIGTADIGGYGGGAPCKQLYTICIDIYLLVDMDKKTDAFVPIRSQYVLDEPKESDDTTIYINVGELMMFGLSRIQSSYFDLLWPHRRSMKAEYRIMDVLKQPAFEMDTLYPQIEAHHSYYISRGIIPASNSIFWIYMYYNVIHENKRFGFTPGGNKTLFNGDMEITTGPQTIDIVELLVDSLQHIIENQDTATLSPFNLLKVYMKTRFDSGHDIDSHMIDVFTRWRTYLKDKFSYVGHKVTVQLTITLESKSPMPDFIKTLDKYGSGYLWTEHGISDGMIYFGDTSLDHTILLLSDRSIQGKKNSLYVEKVYSNRWEAIVDMDDGKTELVPKGTIVDDPTITLTKLEFKFRGKNVVYPKTNFKRIVNVAPTIIHVEPKKLKMYMMTPVVAERRPVNKTELRTMLAQYQNKKDVEKLVESVYENNHVYAIDKADSDMTKTRKDQHNKQHKSYENTMRKRRIVK
jgi:hypothetical protein